MAISGNGQLPGPAYRYHWLNNTRGNAMLRRCCLFVQGGPCSAHYRANGGSSGILFAIELPEYRDFVRNHRGRFINSTI